MSHHHDESFFEETSVVLTEERDEIWEILQVWSSGQDSQTFLTRLFCRCSSLVDQARQSTIADWSDCSHSPAYGDRLGSDGHCVQAVEAEGA